VPPAEALPATIKKKKGRRWKMVKKKKGRRWKMVKKKSSRTETKKPIPEEEELAE